MADKKVTKGKGAGGCNTNKNGLAYEDITNMCNYTKNFTECNEAGKKYRVFDFDGTTSVQVEKKSLQNYLHADYKKQEKSLQPDEAFIDTDKKTIYILEKKFQQTAGSVDEKIQTGMFKRELYEQMYPSYTIEYCYVLSDWFKADKYLPEMRFNKKYGIRVFFWSDRDYYTKMIEWISGKNDSK